MSRLLVHVEGQTEEDFVNEVLRDHLVHKGYESVSARIVGNARLRRKRGGIRAWPTVQRDIVNHLRQDPGCIATTMVDFYGLPESGDGAWPGRSQAKQGNTRSKARCVEAALLESVRNEMGRGFDQKRFVPFVVMHEFEAILFSDCAAFGRGIGRPDMKSAFEGIRTQFKNPEEIDDSPESSPSRRVQDLIEGYEKPLLGTLAVLEIGLQKIRESCPHFADWVETLESYGR
jgi:uncharacterized protein DUF4276